MSENRIGVAVYGMGRSGTSAVTGLLAASGYYVGAPDELLPASDSNPGGHYEHWAVYRLNEEILGLVGRSWFDPPDDEALAALGEQWVPRISDTFERLAAEADGAPLALKDPRLGVMTALWDPVIGERLHPVLVIRDPVEIAMSLMGRDGTPWPFSLASWEIHMTRTLRYLLGRQVTIAPYTAILDSPAVAAEVVSAASSQLESGRAARVNPSGAAGWLERSLYRNVAGPCDHDEMLTGRQAGLWDWLCTLTAGGRVLTVPERLLTTSTRAAQTVAWETERIRPVARGI